MTNKVKVGHEVGEALKDLFSRNEIDYPKEWILQAHYEAINNGDKWSGDKWQHLNKLTMTEMAQAMFSGFEVDPQFKVGDWVVRKDVVAKIIDIEGVPAKHGVTLNTVVGFVYTDELRHATPEEIKAEKERQLWKKIDREVGEFKNGDVMVSKNGEFVEVSNINGANTVYKEKLRKGFYPIGSFISFEELQ